MASQNAPELAKGYFLNSPEGRCPLGSPSNGFHPLHAWAHKMNIDISNVHSPFQISSFILLDGFSPSALPQHSVLYQCALYEQSLRTCCTLPTQLHLNRKERYQYVQHKSKTKTKQIRHFSDDRRGIFSFSK